MESITEIAQKYVIYNATLKMLICHKEQYCLSPGGEKAKTQKYHGISHHFHRSEHKGIPTHHRNAINQYIADLDIANPDDIMIPPPESRPIPGLALYRNGTECLVCNELMSDEPQMKRHCRGEHGWDSKKDPIWKKQAVQLFFKNQGKALKYVPIEHVNSSYIRVNADEYADIEPLSAMSKLMLESLLKTSKEQDDEHIRNLNKIQDNQPLSALSAWRTHVAWEKKFANRDMGEFLALSKRPAGNDKRIHAWNATKAMIEIRFQGVLDLHERNWHLIPFWLASVEAQQAESVPFRRYFRPDTVQKYAEVWQQYICFCLGAFSEPEKYGVQFMENQKIALSMHVRVRVHRKT
jgi:hypothetical protein